MSTSRRDFLKKGSLVALVAGVPVSLAERAMAKTVLPASGGMGLSKAAFMAELNTDFFLNDPSGICKVRLVAVEDLRRTGEYGNGKECFSLLFKGSRTPIMKQDTYLIEHARLGTFSFLLVPMMKTDQNAAQYEAIVNQLHP
jgi:hypothetical protein